jgi:hypothetical protein
MWQNLRTNWFVLPNFQTAGTHSKKRFGRMQKRYITGEDKKVSEKTEINVQK